MSVTSYRGISSEGGVYVSDFQNQILPPLPYILMFRKVPVTHLKPAKAQGSVHFALLQAASCGWTTVIHDPAAG